MHTTGVVRQAANSVVLMQSECVPEVPYLTNAAETGRAAATSVFLTEIATEIERSGYWQRVFEWRISTETTSRIEPALDPRGREWFKVSVSCDAEMVCHAPTLERAVEFMQIFDRLTVDLFWSVGWPSAAANRREYPKPGQA